MAEIIDLAVALGVAPNSIPLPVWPFTIGRPWRRRRCPLCTARFRGGRAYRGHYALVHLLGLR